MDLNLSGTQNQTRPMPYFSETLEEFDADIDDSIESQGETTVYPSGDEWLQNPLEGAPRLFFRIEENQ